MATGIDVSIAGQKVEGFGKRVVVTSYTVDEESTPVDVSDTTGATGRFTIPIFGLSTLKAKRTKKKTLDLSDLGQGKTRGIVRVPSMAQGTISISADQEPILLAVKRTAQPYTGTLGGYFVYLLGLVGITSDYVIDSSLNAVAVSYPGWNADVWLMLKKLAAKHRAEISYVSDLIVFRPVRGRVTIDKRDTEYSWVVDDSNLALSVEGYYYQNVYGTDQAAYPIGGWNEDVPIYQVAAGETVEFNVPLSASLLSVQQPVAQDYVDRYFTTASVYSVMSSTTGLPIPAAQWTDNGGSVTVAIGEDTTTLIITITGAADPTGSYGPYRIAATAGPSDNYSSLRLVGTGVFFTKTLLNIPTAIDPSIASLDIGVTVDSPFISTLTELFDALIWTLARYGGNKQTITVSTTGINRAGDSGSYASPKISDFNAEAIAAGWTAISLFNTAKAGQTIAQFNAFENAKVESSFVNQAFGNIAGARTLRDYIYWRIRTTSVSPGSITYTAEADTTVGDFNTVWKTSAGVAETIAKFNTEHAGHTIGDFNVAPLERAA